MKKTLLLTVLLMSFGSSVFAAWPPPSTDYLIKEWQANAGTAAYGYGQIIYYQGGFYEVTNPDGVDSWGGVDYWNPENLSTQSSTVGCDCEADYQKIAEGTLWVENMGTITEGVNYIWDGAVYECITSGESWGSWYSPTGGNDASYKKICDIELVPVVEEGCLPDNFVGYFYRASLAWKIGWIGINWETKLAYKCVAQTHPYDFVGESGGEWPGTQYGYWDFGTGAWNDPPVPVCEEKDLLTTVDIPEWSACEWPLGSIVQYEGKYYIYNLLDGVIYYPSDQPMAIESVLETLPYTEEVPGEGSDWTLYDPANTQIKQLSTNQLTYFVQDGRLVVNSQEESVSIQLYNLTGQTVAAIVGKSIELPEKGAYIAKINTGGKTTVVKVLK